MDLGRIPLFSLITRRMDWLGERQRVLAQNVANADTPGFQPQDLKPFETGGGARSGARLAPATTDPAHSAGRGTGGAFGTKRIKAIETTLSGNGVSLERELMKSADTAMDYQLVTNIYRKQLGMLRTVLTRS
jgi:flagellar basal-body rod protein FlgB